MIERCLAVVLQWTLTTFNDLVATEVYNDVLIVSEKNKMYSDMMKSICDTVIIYYPIKFIHGEICKVIKRISYKQYVYPFF